MTSTRALPLALMLFSVPLLPAVSHADENRDPKFLMTKLKAAMEPPKPTLQHVEVLIKSKHHVASWQARQARRPSDKGSAIVTVMLEPASIRGSAFLIEEQEDGPDTQYLYLPATRRVRKLTPLRRFEPFLDTEFTYADLGFIRVDGSKLRTLGKEVVGDVATYAVEEIPDDTWYYGRIVNYIAVDTLLPVRRDIFTPGGVLWKRQHFDSILEIEGVPTPTVIRMEDVREGESTTLQLTKVDYEADLPDELFDPSQLPKLVDHPLWNE